jgi:hypothetical protein
MCNHRGEILEVSSSCRELFYLTPRILESLRAQLEEGLLLSIFNPSELRLSSINFDGNTSVFFRSITLDFSELNKLIRGTENHEEEVLDHIGSFKKRLDRSNSTQSNTPYRA